MCLVLYLLSNTEKWHSQEVFSLWLLILESPLTFAAHLDNVVEIIKVLKNGGAHLDFRAKDGMTALHKAARSKNQVTLTVKGPALLRFHPFTPAYLCTSWFPDVGTAMQAGQLPDHAWRSFCNIKQRQTWMSLSSSMRWWREEASDCSCKVMVKDETRLSLQSFPRSLISFLLNLALLWTDNLIITVFLFFLFFSSYLQIIILNFISFDNLITCTLSFVTIYEKYFLTL